MRWTKASETAAGQASGLRSRFSARARGSVLKTWRQSPEGSRDFRSRALQCDGPYGPGEGTGAAKRFHRSKRVEEDAGAGSGRPASGYSDSADARPLPGDRRSEPLTGRVRPRRAGRGRDPGTGRSRPGDALPTGRLAAGRSQAVDERTHPLGAAGVLRRARGLAVGPRVQGRRASRPLRRREPLRRCRVLGEGARLRAPGTAARADARARPAASPAAAALDCGGGDSRSRACGGRRVPASPVGHDQRPPAKRRQLAAAGARPRHCRSRNRRNGPPRRAWR